MVFEKQQDIPRIRYLINHLFKIDSKQIKEKNKKYKINLKSTRVFLISISQY